MDDFGVDLAVELDHRIGLGLVLLLGERAVHHERRADGHHQCFLLHSPSPPPFVVLFLDMERLSVKWNVPQLA
jgi:hypothetical protein